MQYGRRQIFTHEEEITSENLIKVLQQAMIDFLPNVNDCTFLINYEKGIQEKIRPKLTRKDIDCWCVDNVANQVTTFKKSFNWSNPITLIQRGEKDSGEKNEAAAIAILNEYYDAQEIKKKTQELARFVEITGIGYTLIEINTEWEEGDSPFIINVLDPRYAFVVRSNYYSDRRVVLGVTFRQDSLGNYYFTCYTKNRRFEVINTVKIINGKTNREKKVNIWEEGNRSGEENPLHRIPVIEWIRDFDRMGCFERQIPEMDNLNLMISDFSNDVEQNTMAIWHSNDVDFPTEIVKDKDGNEKEVVKKPKSGEWLQTYTPQDGKTPLVEPLTVNYDYAGMLNNIIARRALILEKCNVPQRSEANNSTGIAVSDSSGWTNAEIEATMQDMIKYGCKMEEVKCVLAAIKETALAKVDDRVSKLHYSDVMPITRRQKNYELSVKTTALSTLLNCGVYGLHAFNTVNLFEDVNQVWEDSSEMIKKKQNTSGENENKNTTVDGGYEAQISNSPRIDGLSKEKPIETEESKM